jgi:hypothetical protein
MRAIRRVVRAVFEVSAELTEHQGVADIEWSAASGDPCTLPFLTGVFTHQLIHVHLLLSADHQEQRPFADWQSLESVHGLYLPSLRSTPQRLPRCSILSDDGPCLA